ncbi:hypothetical protein NLM24_00635 [Nocardia zapadnayensis]|uniref:hypothetical protein n=1 Tax=Nocardia rhamnosiphila TaxID=426716 RepID=UPI002247B3D8|nr:hypothetical protein [Nocardia zapadnayensis]MCX0269241.1 hypothetical protein [Nocardia zapadnayensis]
MAEQHGSPLTRAGRQDHDESAHRAVGARVRSGTGAERRPALIGVPRGVRCTEFDGRRVLWWLDRDCVRVVEVRDASGSRMPVSGAPDLAEMRERCPELASLWDAVRHDLWSRLAAAVHG